MMGDCVLNGPELQKGIPTPEDLYRMYHSDAAGLPSEPVQVMPDKIPVDSRHKAQRSGSAQPRVRDQGVRGVGRSKKIRSTSTMPRRQRDLERRLDAVLECLEKKVTGPPRRSDGAGGPMRNIKDEEADRHGGAKKDINHVSLRTFSSGGDVSKDLPLLLLFPSSCYASGSDVSADLPLLLLFSKLLPRTW